MVIKRRIDCQQGRQQPPKLGWCLAVRTHCRGGRHGHPLSSKGLSIDTLYMHAVLIFWGPVGPETVPFRPGRPRMGAPEDREVLEQDHATRLAQERLGTTRPSNPGLRSRVQTPSMWVWPPTERRVQVLRVWVLDSVSTFCEKPFNGLSNLQTSEQLKHKKQCLLPERTVAPSASRQSNLEVQSYELL